jgi:hypothetical protein
MGCTTATHEAMKSEQPLRLVYRSFQYTGRRIDGVYLDCPVCHSTLMMSYERWSASLVRRAA